MKIVNALIAVAALSSGVAMSAEKKDHGTPNCEKAGGKKFHAKDQAACEKGKGNKWLEATAASAPAAAPAGEAAAPAPAEAPHK